MRSLPFTGGDEELRQELEKLADPGYKTFHEGLIPGASMSYGVRLPDMRALAQKVLRGDPVGFLKGTHPASYEETMVRGLVVAGLKLPWVRPKMATEKQQLARWHCKACPWAV